LVQEESKNLRYLQRVSLMQRSLLEDSEHVKASLRHTERLRERAQKNFEVIDQENREETQAVESQIGEMQRAIEDMKAALKAAESEKAKLKRVTQD
jgi:peptidoglycan hydrolase CwlO-like protein